MRDRGTLALSDPYVVTLALGDEAQHRLDADRRRWFPVGRTEVGAHVTLFHAVPGTVDVQPALVAATERERFTVAVSGAFSLGRGVAYRLESDALLALHGMLRTAWASHLTRQDAQPYRPHVTVQNKASVETARDTLATVRASFEPWTAAAVGVDLWWYRGGPWEHSRRYALR